MKSRSPPPCYPSVFHHTVLIANLRCRPPEHGRRKTTCIIDRYVIHRLINQSINSRTSPSWSPNHPYKQIHLPYSLAPLTFFLINMQDNNRILWVPWLIDWLINSLDLVQTLIPTWSFTFCLCIDSSIFNVVSKMLDSRKSEGVFDA